MSYIKFHIRRTTDDAGNITNARISRLESDMADVNTYELNLIMHALAAPGGKVETVRVFILGFGILDNENDLLG